MREYKKNEGKSDMVSSGILLLLPNFVKFFVQIWNLEKVCDEHSTWKSHNIEVFYVTV